MVRKILMGVAIATSLATIASAQTADELVAKYIQAKGGMEKIKACQTTRVTGKMVMAQGMEAPFSRMAKRPNQTRMEFTIQGMTGIQAYDGQHGWTMMPFMGSKDPQAMSEAENKLMAEEAEFDGTLVECKSKGSTVELVGKEQVEGADAYKLKLTKKSGDVSYHYLDAETYLEIKSEAKRTMRGTEFDGESTIGDFKEVNGMMFPFSIESGMKGNPQKRKIVIDKIEINPNLADSLFALPPGTKPAGGDTTVSAGKAAHDSASARSTKAKTTAKKTVKKATATPKKATATTKNP